MCQVRVEDVEAGKETPEWVLGFLPRVWTHPWSVTRARMLSGEDTVDQLPEGRSGSVSWVDWWGYMPETQALQQLVNAKSKKPVYQPPEVNYRLPEGYVADDLDGFWSQIQRARGIGEG